MCEVQHTMGTESGLEGEEGLSTRGWMKVFWILIVMVFTYLLNIVKSHVTVQFQGITHTTWE